MTPEAQAARIAQLERELAAYEAEAVRALSAADKRHASNRADDTRREIELWRQNKVQR
jgi:hypothetical protein